MAWILAHKRDIPKGKQVLHKCDNPPCMNPAHIYLGTPKDNMDDKKRRGRDNRPNGEDFKSAKLTERLVVDVRKRFAAGESMRSLAREIGCSHTTIKGAIRRVTWKHVS